MHKLNEITEKYKNLRYMKHEQAVYLRDLIHQNKFKNLCELGHFHGKSSIYIGSILEEQGFGQLTTFDILSTKRSPNINNLINEFSLENYVKPIVSVEGYAWDLANLVKADSEKFDFCYIDGGHTFESTLIAFVLIDILMQPGGIIVFDDLNWTVANSVATLGPAILNIPMYQGNTLIQKITPGVKLVCDLIVPHYNYSLIEIVEEFDWAIFRKN
jgi:predicted O-methyltransferase YrrM